MSGSIGVVACCEGWTVCESEGKSELVAVDAAGPWGSSVCGSLADSGDWS